MQVVVQIIGIIFVLMGIMYLLKPDVLKRLIEFFKKGKRLYFAGLIRLVLAVVFLLAARECDITWVIFTFGILFLISGLLTFMLGPKRLKSMLDWWERRSSVLIRVVAVIALAIGVAIIYSA